MTCLGLSRETFPLTVCRCTAAVSLPLPTRSLPYVGLPQFSTLLHLAAFKEQDLAVRQAVEFADGRREGRKVGELMSLLLCTADCLVCGVDASLSLPPLPLSHTVLNTSNPFLRTRQVFLFCFAGKRS